jgi:NH3-dependent NAD+ synthetase
MAQKQIVKRKPSPELDQRFTNIESRLQTIEDQIEYKFKAMEDQLESKFQAAIEKKDVGSPFVLQSPMIQFLRSLDLSKIGALLQNPMIQSLFSDNKNRKNGKKRSSGSSGLDLATIGNLLQNPMVQSLLKSQMDKKMIG